MNKIQYEKLLKPLINIYDDIELDIINNILNRLDNYNEVSGSLKWYLEKLADLGTLDEENLKVLKKNKKLIKATLESIINRSGTNIDYLDKLNDYYNKGLIEVNPNNLNKSYAINNLINEALKDSNNIIELINTKAIEGAKDSYRNILNKAYIETSSGVYTYNESIRRAIDEMAKEGIKIVNYESGKHFTIESTVRRDVITRVNKLVGDCEIEQAKELNTNLVYVDQHLGARVRTKYTKHDYEVHAEWQGKKYMIDGSSEEYDNLYEKTGYGEMLGLKGINCYHNLRPTWEWEKIPDRIDEIENANAYEDLETQRSFERKIREIKRRKLVAKELNDTEEYKKLNKRFNKVNSQFNDWIDNNNLRRDYGREYISDIKVYKDITKETINNRKPNGKVINRKYFVDKNGQKYIVDGKNVIYNPDLKELEMAKWIKNTFGGNIYLNPKVNNPSGVKTSDYLWNNESWDLKTLSERATSLTRAVDNVIKKSKGQTDNIILDITKCKLDNKDILKQVKKVYSTKGREWVNKIMIVDNYNLLKIYKRQ